MAILGGGPGFTGRGSHTTSTFRGNSLGARQRRIAQALSSGFRTDFQRISKGLQDAVVTEIGEGLQRPGATTGKLAKTTASPRNRQVGDDFFIVGVEDYLRYTGKGKGQKAAYALAIEEGTDKLIGNRLTGVWISGGQFLPFGAPSPNQFFRASRARVARRLLDKPGRVSGYIQEPILAHHDYDAAWEKYNPRRQILLAVNRRLDRKGGSG